MTLGEFRKLTAHLPDDTVLAYKDPNFSGEGEDITEGSLYISGDKYATDGAVLIACPYWTAVD